MIFYILAVVIFVLGVYAAIAKKNLIKIIIGIAIMEYAVNLMLVLVGYRTDGLAPIVTNAQQPMAAFADAVVDPLPQALVITSIVIGLAMTALMAALAVRLHQRYGTFDILHMRKLKG